jgi:hypothetical protein
MKAVLGFGTVVDGQFQGLCARSSENAQVVVAELKLHRLAVDSYRLHIQSNLVHPQHITAGLQGRKAQSRGAGDGLLIQIDVQIQMQVLQIPIAVRGRRIGLSGGSSGKGDR